jgi:hypothetical protein
MPCCAGQTPVTSVVWLGYVTVGKTPRTPSEMMLAGLRDVVGPHAVDGDHQHRLMRLLGRGGDGDCKTEGDEKFSHAIHKRAFV